MYIAICTSYSIALAGKCWSSLKYYARGEVKWHNILGASSISLHERSNNSLIQLVISEPLQIISDRICTANTTYIAINHFRYSENLPRLRGQHHDREINFKKIFDYTVEVGTAILDNFDNQSLKTLNNK